MKRTYLREWRKHSNKTLEQVAAELGMTHQNLGKIERGIQPYNQHLLEFLADLYNCDEAALIMRPPGASRDIRQVADQVPVHMEAMAVNVLEALIKTGTDG